MLSLLCGLLIGSSVRAAGTDEPGDGGKASKDSAMKPVKDDPKLPRVLIIGDSISIGYTVPVRALLQGKANVHRPLTNCGPTTNGLKHIDEWLGDGKWDVIHFNWGLHDLKFIGDKGDKIVPVNSPGAHYQVPIDEYEANLDKLVARLKQTGAKLIWRNTTPVPEGTVGRIVGDSAKYNEAAARVMKKYDVPTQDMFTFVKDHPDTQLKANVHFTPDGYKALAQTVVTEIEKYLK
ncbi:MAG: SGNH/GDSL hydrolase family protein [Planctomycetes bacterium]|nr:SGNH/GDSL hydrolase family protein [Planctomycetota bacterium]